MPSQVPAGYTRGAILFIGPLQDADGEAALLQRFWNEAGGYGARILIVSAFENDLSAAQRYNERFEEWESEWVAILPVQERTDARRDESAVAVEQATGVLLVGDNPLRMAGLLGGTLLATAIRRANARGKVVCGIGACAPILCQHMIAYDNRKRIPHPFLHRRLIQFAPGLGIVNRLLLDSSNDPAEGPAMRLSRLLAAVAHNPFLVGVSLEADTGVAVYADTTLEVFGRNSALIVDGSEITYTDVHKYEDDGPLSVLGVQAHVLGRAYTFNFDSRLVQPPDEGDIPPPTTTAQIAF
ncbi:MAG: cyanophycinase [Caldilineaceae bacterium]|nr:cyanophycinase [Caldilineaceae bacterium]MCB9140280.1 cyanophycinase [Caldilineaceae bacterium]